MKKLFCTIAVIGCISISAITMAQTVNAAKVPAAAKAALLKKYPKATKVTWEKEKGNFESNWGGKEGEDMSVTFTPAGVFVEQVEAIQLSALPAAATTYLHTKYKGAKVAEAGKATDAAGKITYEAEVKGKEVVFDETGKFLKVE